MMLPICRHRGPELAPGRFDCHSSRLVIPAEGVTADTCRRCPYVNHEPDPPPPVPRDKPCTFLGIETVRLVECPTCRGKVTIKVLTCALHGHCTIHKPVPNVPCCASCKDYQAEQ